MKLNKTALGFGVFAFFLMLGLGLLMHFAITENLHKAVIEQVENMTIDKCIDEMEVELDLTQSKYSYCENYVNDVLPTTLENVKTNADIFFVISVIIVPTIFGITRYMMYKNLPEEFKRK